MKKTEIVRYLDGRIKKLKEAIKNHEMDIRVNRSWIEDKERAIMIHLKLKGIVEDDNNIPE